MYPIAQEVSQSQAKSGSLLLTGMYFRESLKPSAKVVTTFRKSSRRALTTLLYFCSPSKFSICNKATHTVFKTSEPKLRATGISYRRKLVEYVKSPDVQLRIRRKCYNDCSRKPQSVKAYYLVDFCYGFIASYDERKLPEVRNTVSQSYLEPTRK